jgi:two-component system NtrC family sensor kinase
MRIGVKLTLALIVPLASLTLFLSYLYQDRNRAILRDELMREGRAIARVVQIASEDYLRDRQLSDLRQLADQVTGYERVLGVRLFDPDGNIRYQPAALGPYPFEAWNELHAALDHRRMIEMRRRVGSQTALGFIVPLVGHDGRLAGAIQVLQLESYVERDARAARDFVLMLTVAMVLATIGVVLLVTRFNISHPIERLVTSFREVGARDVPTRVPVRGDDELALLSREFNGMCERLDDARRRLLGEQESRRRVEMQLRVAERLAGLGRLAAGLAHEIGTPLNVILGRAESVRRSMSESEPASRQLQVIVSESERIARIVRDMLDFARPKPPRRIPTDVGATLGAVTNLLDRQCERQQVKLETTLAPDLPRVTADPDQLQQVMLNLIVNALDAMPEGGRLRIQVRLTEARPPGGEAPLRRMLALDFEDSGSGIRADHLEHVFDPFFTTKAAGRGTGLGLSVSYGIVEEHGGWFDVESHPGQGARFTILLPVDPDAAETEATA